MASSEMSGRNLKTTRFYIARDLFATSRYGMSARQLHAALQDRGFDVDLKTVRRDIDALQESGIPLLECGKDNNNGVILKLDPSRKLVESIVMDRHDLWTIYLMKSLLHTFKKAPFFTEITSAFAKIEARFDERMREYVNELEEDVAFHHDQSTAHQIDQEVWDAVRHALEEKHILEILYRKPDGVTKRRVGPLFVLIGKGACYLRAEDLDAGGIKNFSLSRMDSARMLPESYENESFPQQISENSFGTYLTNEPPSAVKLLFKPEAAQYVMERNVLAPATLRAELAKTAAAVAQKYRCISPSVISDSSVPKTGSLLQHCPYSRPLTTVAIYPIRNLEYAEGSPCVFSTTCVNSIEK